MTAFVARLFWSKRIATTIESSGGPQWCYHSVTMHDLGSERGNEDAVGDTGGWPEDHR